jgi:uncharacterized protein YecT (DUF1311 family)
MLLYKHMKVEWNKVTWYSKLIAVIVFGATFFIAYKIGIAVGSATQSITDSQRIASEVVPSKVLPDNNIATEDPCTGDNTSQMDIDSCESGAYEKLDNQLTDVYRAILSNIISDANNYYPYGPQIQKDFIASEQKWQAYRTAECTAEADTAVGGSIQPEIQAVCLQAVTKDRITYLSSPGLF